jgi:hypothetical protein
MIAPSLEHDLAFKPGAIVQAIGPLKTLANVRSLPLGNVRRRIETFFGIPKTSPIIHYA